VEELKLKEEVKRQEEREYDANVDSLDYDSEQNQSSDSNNLQ